MNAELPKVSQRAKLNVLGIHEISNFSGAQASGLSEDSLAPGNNLWSLRRMIPLDPNPWILEKLSRCSPL